MTSKFTFKQEYTGFNSMTYSSPPATITMEVTGDLSLSEVVEKFQDFLRGAGYVFDGHLELVDDEPSYQYSMTDDTDSLFTDDSINLSGTGAGETYVVSDDVEHSTFYFDTDRNKPVKV